MKTMNLSIKKSPHALVEDFSLREARWTGGFWAAQFEHCRQHIVPHLWDVMKGTSPTHFLENFRIAAGLSEGRQRGAPFNDGDFYKWMEAAAATLAVHPDAELERRLEEIIGIIAKAQRADGYIHTKVLVAHRQGDFSVQPFQKPTDFEAYNMGHLLTAACVHHAATGCENLLDVARKTADFLVEIYRNPTPQLMLCAVCPSHYKGLVDMYRVTAEPRYLETAHRLIALRDMVTGGGDDNQDRVPFREQREAVGHAVRANYLYAGAAAIFLETGDASLREPLDSIWQDVTNHKLYITGGCGALYDGASPDASIAQATITRVHQAYGRNYQLPNQTAHNETCANIGSVLWNWQMFRATGQAQFMDLLEGTLLNSVLCGATQDGALYSYTNPLRFLETQPVPLRYGAKRAAFNSSFCCPPNLARVMAQMQGFAYAKSENAVWINLYGDSVWQTTLNGAPLNIAQRSDYPYQGRVQATFQECAATPFALKLRIPAWAKNAKMQLNGKAMKEKLAVGSYFEIHRQWRAGDVVVLDLPMPTQLIEAHRLVEENANHVAVQRGPLVYCLESTDLPRDIKLSEVHLPATTYWKPRSDSQFFGATVLEGEAIAFAAEAWQSGLYREFSPKRAQKFRTRLVPYFLWGNRGTSEMTVWLPLHR